LIGSVCQVATVLRSLVNLLLKLLWIEEAVIGAYFLIKEVVKAAVNLFVSDVVV
jgi:hypothetical protein